MTKPLPLTNEELDNLDRIFGKATDADDIDILPSTVQRLIAQARRLPTVSEGEREQLARIIDPWAFGETEERVDEAFIQGVAQSKAFAKADEWLSRQPVLPTPVGREEVEKEFDAWSLIYAGNFNPETLADLKASVLALFLLPSAEDKERLVETIRKFALAKFNGENGAGAHSLFFTMAPDLADSILGS